MGKIFWLIAIVVAGGCSTVDVGRYAGNTPRFELYEYFEGRTKGYGIVQDRQGRVTRQFVVTIEGTVSTAGELTMHEWFQWNDGEQSERIWVISSPESNSYVGRAHDVIGTATGTAAGNALIWRYVLLLEVDGRQWRIDFDDWMFLQPDRVLLNRTKLSKFGVHLGDVTIAFIKQ